MLSYSLTHSGSQGKKASMNKGRHFYNPLYNTKEIRSHLFDLVAENDHFDDLTSSEKFDFAKLFIKVAGIEFLYESDAATLLPSLLSDDQDGLVDDIKQIAIDYYETTMKNLFDEARSEYQAERAEWLDCVAKNGDPDEAYDQFRDEFLNY